MAIEEIEIQGVRGIRNALRIGLQGKSLLLRGDNGTGKSSVERALRWALAGQEEPTAEDPFTSESSYRRHVAVGAEDPWVRVAFDDGSSIAVAPGSVETLGKGEEYRAACQRGFPFLRRAELLDVLSSKPVDRFQYFESFLGFEHVDTLVDDLTNLESKLRRRSSELTQKIDRELAALRPLLPPDGQHEAENVEDLERAALAVARSLGVSTAEQGWNEVAFQVLALAEVAADDELEHRRGQLVALRSDLKEFIKVGETSELVFPEDIEAKRKEIESETLEAPDILLIEDALRHFRSEEGDTCPVCGQEIDWEETRNTLAERSAKLASYRDLLEARLDAAEAWLARWGTFRGLHARFTDLFGKEGALPTLAEIPNGLDLLIDQDVPRKDAEAIIIAIGGSELRKFLAEASETARHAVSKALKALPSASQLPQLRLGIALFQRFQDRRAELLLLESELETLRQEADTVSKIHEALRRTRQDVAQEILERVGETVSEYYARLHPPDEPHERTGPPTIDVQRHGRGTAFVRGAFDGNEVRDPQWIYSDGHLDTVGICIFLALRRYRGNEPDDPRLLVLDDVVVSIDLGHARRLIEVLRNEFADHQILLFTHNGLFAHWCANLIPGLRKVEIKRWSLNDGPRIGEYVDARDQLEASLEDDSAKQIALHLMALMDEWLAEARYAYSVAVPARPDEQYTITEIWQPFARTLRKLGKAMSSDLGGAVSRAAALQDLPAIRNALPAHENEFAREFPRNVIVQIAGEAINLVDSLYCRDCLTFASPKPSRTSPSIVHCSCHSLQYVPPS